MKDDMLNSNLIMSKSNIVTPSLTNSIALTQATSIADSGATDSVFKLSDKKYLKHYNSIGGLTVKFPNGSMATSVGTGTFFYKQIGIKVHVFNDEDIHHSVISLADFTNQDCIITLSKHALDIHHDGNNIMKVSKDIHSKAWYIPLEETNTIELTLQPSISNVIRHQFNHDLVKYHHMCLGSPTESTFDNAISKQYIKIPKLTHQIILNNPIQSIATANGHLDLKRQAHRSTSVDEILIPNQNIHTRTEILDPETNISQQEHKDEEYSIAQVYSMRDIADTMFSDLPGALSKSIDGDMYVMITIFRNYIIGFPMKDRSQEEHIIAYEKTLDYFKGCKVDIKYAIMDNECSKEVKIFFDDHDIELQLVPPSTHRANEAEKAVRRFKNQFISTFSTCAPDFPMNLWNLALPQIFLCLNILSPYSLNSNISAYEGIHSTKYDFEAHPIVPFGINVLCYVKPEDRKTYGNHGDLGWYIGPSLISYQSYIIYIKNTHRTRLTNTVAFFPNDIHIPGSDPASILYSSLTDLNDKLLLLTTKDDVNVTELLLPIHKTIQDITTPQPLLDDEPFQTILINDSQTDTLKRVIIKSNPNPLNSTSPISSRTRSHLNIIQNTTDQLNKSRLTHLSQNILPTYNIPEKIVNYHYISALQDEVTGKLLTYRDCMSGPDKEFWMRASSEEFIRLLDTTKTMKFIFPSQKPKDRKGTYYNPVPSIKIKDDVKVYRIRGTAGGDLITDYPYATSAFVADVETVKILLNAAISEQDAKLMTADANDFFLCSTLPRSEYIKIKRSVIPEDIITRYSLQDPKYWIHDYIWVEVTQGMYGLPQAAILAQEQLYRHLSANGYDILNLTSGLVANKARTLFFTLVVDDFLIKYTNMDDVKHLQSVLEKLYVMKYDFNATKYLGITIEQNRQQDYIGISIPGYIDKVLSRFQVVKSTRPVNTPSPFIPHNYGSKTPQLIHHDLSQPATTDEVKWLQQVVGSLLYYARLIDSTMLFAVNRLASAQAHATKNTIELAKHLLQYAAWHPNATIKFYPSDMQLLIDSDAAFNSEAKARSRAAGFWRFHSTKYPDIVNGPIKVLCSIIHLSVVGSACEAEYAALYMNATAAVPIRQTLQDFGYPQNATLLITDNEAAHGIANDHIHLHKSKAIDMRYHWIRDRIAQGQFKTKWDKGCNNLADYFTKAHPASHHKDLRHVYISYIANESIVKGCIIQKPEYINGTIDLSINGRNEVKVNDRTDNGWTKTKEKRRRTQVAPLNLSDRPTVQLTMTNHK